VTQTQGAKNTWNDHKGQLRKVLEMAVMYLELMSGRWCRSRFGILNPIEIDFRRGSASAEPSKFNARRHRPDKCIAFRIEIPSS